nr:3'-5' exonuclease [uncultured Rhodoferax sp.]
MATLIPALGSCVSRMTSGERRLAERLEAKLDDGIPLLKPISCGRDGEAPLIIRLPSLRDEAFAIADEMGRAHQEGHAWGDMAILCHDYFTMDLCAKALEQRKLPFNVRKRAGDFNPRANANAIQIMTMKVSKGLEFPVVALPGVGHMPAAGEDEQEAAQVFYVAATRATQRLVMGVSGSGVFCQKII